MPLRLRLPCSTMLPILLTKLAGPRAVSASQALTTLQQLILSVGPHAVLDLLMPAACRSSAGAAAREQGVNMHIVVSMGQQWRHGLKAGANVHQHMPSAHMR